MILSAGAESMILSECTESIILSVGLLLPPLSLCCCRCCLCLRRGSSGSCTGVAVCRPRGGDVATTVVDFLLLLLHAKGVVVFHLFPASSVAATVVLGAVIL
jgi:hypothetical protein